jgi:lysophospholipid acyltransferase (LPLAT)-like uncharacterized protein
MEETPITFKARCISRLLHWFLEAVLMTCRIRITGQENLLQAFKKGPTLIYLWHNRLTLIGTLALKAFPTLRFCSFVSNSKDGEILAAYSMSFRRGSTIRVPHDNKDRALKMLINRLKLKKDVPIVTPDGPKGPAYQVKPGIVLAARESGAALIPFTWRAKSYFELGTWDKLRIPKPFSTIEAEFGPAIYLDPEKSVEEETPRVKEALESIS